MNKDTAKDFLPLVQALAEGRVIQIKWSDGQWHDSEHLYFVHERDRYRIKPEPKDIWLNEYPDGFCSAHASERAATDNKGKSGVTRRYREVIE